MADRRRRAGRAAAAPAGARRPATTGRRRCATVALTTTAAAGRCSSPAQPRPARRGAQPRPGVQLDVTCAGPVGPPAPRSAPTNDRPVRDPWTCQRPKVRSSDRSTAARAGVRSGSEPCGRRRCGSAPPGADGRERGPAGPRSAGRAAAAGPLRSAGAGPAARPPSPAAAALATRPAGPPGRASAQRPAVRTPRQRGELLTASWPAQLSPVAEHAVSGRPASPYRPG